ncbi:MAG: hypothetical protein KGI27_14870, partial [Thaumarchaeota archaeon]|nr:hypothetical protein [Nitrososphaerota archaeon]
MGLGAATVTGGQTDPAGGATASSIACTTTGAFVNVAVFSTSPSTTVTDSIWMKGATGGESVAFGDNYNTGQMTAYTLTTSWTRYVNTGSTSSGN